MADPTLENVALEVGFITEPETIFDPSGKESFVGLACFLPVLLLTGGKT